MKTYILDTLERYKRLSRKLDAKTVICNRSWVVFNDCGEREVYKFKEDGSMQIILSGRITVGKWEFDPNDNSISIFASDQALMVHPGMYDDVVMALKVDGTDEISFLIDSNNKDNFVPQSLTELLDYFEAKNILFLKAQEEERRRREEQELKRIAEQKAAEERAKKRAEEELKARLEAEEKAKRDAAKRAVFEAANKRVRNQVLCICVLFVIIVAVVMLLPSLHYSQKSDTVIVEKTDTLIQYAQNGFVVKYFNDKWQLVYSKSEASYYREAYYKNGAIIGDSITKEYDINGKLQFVGKIIFEDTLVYNDTCVWYNGKDIILAKRYYDATGKLQGECRRYYDDGTLYVWCYYADDKLNGKYYQYYEDGNVEYAYNYTNGSRDGSCVEYHSDGVVYSREQYKMGELHGKQFYYYDDGTIRKTCSYVAGELNGEYKEYYMSGKIQRFCHYVNGDIRGMSYFYYENGNVEESHNHNGDKEYAVRQYYETGKIKAKGYYGGSFLKSKSGIWYYYDEHGNVTSCVDETQTGKDFMDSVDRSTPQELKYMRKAASLYR